MHVIFAEPTHAPCMTLGLATGLNDGIACSDIGLDGKTAADGLAVGRASRLVGDIMSTLLEACFTIEDDKLYPFLTKLADSEGIFIEPSACASFTGPMHLTENLERLSDKNLKSKMKNATHILWATGGSMVPEAEMRSYYEQGK